MFVDLDWPLNASSLLSASAELLVFTRATFCISRLLHVIACLSVTRRYCMERIKISSSNVESGCELEKFLSSYYWLFKYTSAWWEYYSKFTDSADFPCKFCNHHWGWKCCWRGFSFVNKSQSFDCYISEMPVHSKLDIQPIHRYLYNYWVKTSSLTG